MSARCRKFLMERMEERQMMAADLLHHSERLSNSGFGRNGGRVRRHDVCDIHGSAATG